MHGMPPAETSNVALAHHWLTTMRGGEKVLGVLARMFPAAPIYTLLARRERLSAELAGRDLRTSPLQRFAFLRDVQRRALPLLPWAVRRLDARGHDVVICSDAANMKAIRTRPDALKICYCHSPIRYVWDLYEEYLAAAGPVARLGLRLSAPRLRRHDHSAAQTVTVFIANSRCVADRIRRCYQRPSVVIPPPVDTDFPPALETAGEFYLVVSEHVSYKRNDIAIQACNRLRAPLVVIGAGPQLEQMREIAGPTVQVLGWQDDATVRDHLRRCRALLFCGVEDFGMVPVEAQAAGRPVIAFGQGGALETVVPGETGLFFKEQTAESLGAAIRQFEAAPPSRTPVEIQAHARQFSVEQFRARFGAFYAWCVEHHEAGGVDRVRARMEGLSPDAFLDLGATP